MNDVFDQRAEEYDRWFDEHPAVYLSELNALRRAACHGIGLEVGVGTGRFAISLGISTGIDSSLPMLSLARRRGVEVVRGVAERLPFSDGSFDLALFMTSLCYLNDPWKAMAEARRVVRGHGRIVIGFIDRASPLGREHVERVRGGPFYQDARFYSAAEVKELLCRTGDGPLECVQTIFDDPGKMTAPDPAVEGHGKGLFAVMSVESRGREGNKAARGSRCGRTVAATDRAGHRSR